MAGDNIKQINAINKTKPYALFSWWTVKRNIGNKEIQSR